MAKIELFDTHCHIHESEYADKYTESQQQLLDDAKKAGVKSVISVGTDLKNSLEAASFARIHPDTYASLAIHPHEANQDTINELLGQFMVFERLLDENNGKIVAIGECGLDYFYHHDKQTQLAQKQLLIRHIELAQSRRLPMIFYVRDAFEDFFEIIDKFKGVKGVVHSFSSGVNELRGVLDRGLYVGLNGIITFTKEPHQLDAARMVPLEKLVLETDAPFLTPKPFRGKMCKPEHIRVTAEFLSELRGESLEDLATATTTNAKRLFRL